MAQCAKIKLAITWHKTSENKDACSLLVVVEIRVLRGVLLERDTLEVGGAHVHGLVVEEGDQVGGLTRLVPQVFVGHAHGDLVGAGGDDFDCVLV